MSPFCHRPKRKLRPLISEEMAWQVAAVLEQKLWDAGYFFMVGVNNDCEGYKREITLIHQRDNSTRHALFAVRTQTMAEAITRFAVEWWLPNSRATGLHGWEQLCLELEGVTL